MPDDTFVNDSVCAEMADHRDPVAQAAQTVDEARRRVNQLIADLPLAWQHLAAAEAFLAQKRLEADVTRVRAASREMSPEDAAKAVGLSKGRF